MTAADRDAAFREAQAAREQTEEQAHIHEWVFDGYFWHHCATCDRVS